MFIRLVPFSLSKAALVVASVLVLSAAATPGNNPQSLTAGLRGARALAVSHFSRIASDTGAADQIVARLDSDLTAVALVDPQDTGAFDRLGLRVALDESLVNQLIDDKVAPVSQTPGVAVLRLVRSSADGTLQPLAVYLPASYDTEKSAPVILMLHSQGQTETELLSEPSLRKLADDSGAIFAVPWMRGDRAVDAVTGKDAYDALALLESNYRVDARRSYLAGVSVGGFDVFMLAPLHPDRWTAVLSIAGTLTNDDKDGFVKAMRGKPAFLVIGSDDPLVKVEYVRGAAAFLTANGVDCHYYEQRGGLHSLDSLQPSLQRAWTEMLAGVRFTSPEVDIPSPVPTGSQRY